MIQPEDLLTLTSEIVSAHVSRNNVSAGDLPTLIQSVHGALAGLGVPAVPAEPEAVSTAGAVTVKKSLANPDFIISMIDGKPYKTMNRHIARHGFTAETYRQRYGLKADYPMTAPTYSERRRAMAVTIGLGRKSAPVLQPVPETEPVPASEPVKAKRGRQPKVAAASAQTPVPVAAPAAVETTVDEHAAPKPKRGRPAKLKPAYADEAPSQRQQVKND
jgi:predicted transcriptional regulator